MHPVLRRQAAGGHLELLQRIRERERQPAVTADVVVHGAVEGVGDAGEHAARDRDLRPALEPLVAGPARLEGATRQDDEVGDLAALERQLHDPLLLDDRADAGAPHVHEGRGGFHRHRLLEIPDAPAPH